MDITDKVVKEALTLPLHSNMKNTDIQRVVKGITSFFKNQREICLKSFANNTLQSAIF